MKIFCGGRCAKYPYQVGIIANRGTRTAMRRTITVNDFFERRELSGAEVEFFNLGLSGDTKVFTNWFPAHFPDHCVHQVMVEIDGLKHDSKERQ